MLREIPKFFIFLKSLVVGYALVYIIKDYNDRFLNRGGKMPCCHTIRVASVVLVTLVLSACDVMTLFTGTEETTEPQPPAEATAEDSQGKTTVEIPQLTLAVAPKIAWIPWFFADEEGILQEQATNRQLNIQFVSDNYSEIIEKFVNKEVDAIVINNLDAIAQLVRRDVEADVILITNYSNGSEALLLPANVETNVRHLRGKTFALAEYSAQHYLFDRFLIRNQIPFDEVTIRNTPDVEIPTAFNDREIYGVVTTNPYITRLIQEANVKVVFDSREVPGELFDLLVVDRDILQEHHNLAQALLATWFAIMERLQGNKRGPTLDAMARLANLTREEYDVQLATTPLSDTSTKALSAIRAHRRMQKIMRHIRYFIERHELTGEEAYTNWVSYPGRIPATLHFNGEPLQNFVSPPKGKK
jgi:NitT/TauT family transport system substrate-binding protein